MTHPLKMAEDHVLIPTAAGIMPGFAAWPEGAPRAAVVLYMDAPGFRPELQDMARRIAGQGYFCLLPDFYYRDGEVRFDPETMGRSDRARMFDHMDRLSLNHVREDTRALLAWLDDRADVRPGARGCIGFCMSGQFILSVLATFASAFAAGASLYGTRMVTERPDSPHLTCGAIQGEIYFGFAEEDSHIPANVQGDLRAALDQAGVAYRMDVYSGTRHGFCFPRRWCYAPEAAEQVWDKVFDLFRRRLAG